MAGTSGGTAPANPAPTNPAPPPAQTNQPPQTPIVTYINLPPLRDKRAPQEFKGKKPCQVKHYITHFEALCAEKNVMDPKQKCLGFIQYCADEVAKTLEHTLAYQINNYDQLIKDV